MDNILDLLRGSLTPQNGEPPAYDAMGAAPDESPPTSAPDLAPPNAGGGGGGGILSALGLTRENLPMISRALAGGMSKVKSGTTAGESIAQALGGSLAGGNTYDDEERKRQLAEKTQRELADYRNRNLDETARYHTGTLDVSRQNANTNESYRADQANRGKYSLQNIDTFDAEGKPVRKTVNYDSATGEYTPFTEGTAAGKPGAGAGRDSVFQQRLAIGEKLYGKDSKEAADYAAGTKRLNRSDAMKFGLSQAETEIKENFPLQRSFKTPEDRNVWKNKRANEIADSVLATPELPGKIVAPRAPPAPQPQMMTPGDGGKPLDMQPPKRPEGVPAGSAYSPSRRQWRAPDGTILDETGAPIR